MQKPKEYVNEKNRLEELYSYKIIDAAEEDDFDFLTSMAAQICGTKIALVSLVTDSKQCFISHHGLEAKETSKDVSFCAHAINTPEQPFVVEDARLDDRFFDNPLTLEDPHVVFYAGIPLVNSNGYPLGTLCVIDDKPGHLSDIQLTQLKKLARQTINLLELRRSQIELKEINQHLEEFSAIAAHDLKEPVRMVNQFMERLSDKYKDQLDDTAQKYIHFALDGSKRMNVLIDDLLAFAKVGGADEATFEKVDLNLVFEDALQFKSAVRDEKNARVTKTSLPSVWSDKTAMKLLFQNLIGNALKYQNGKVAPEIEVSCTENQESHTLSFKDNGIGISEENQSKIFNLFTRLHNKQEFSGTGMGLATCKKIVDMHKGKISIDSELGKGAIFHVTIPKFKS